MVEDDIEVEDDSPLRVGEILDGAYQIEAELGRGGIGVVYKAVDLDLGLPVAIKLLLDKWARDRKMVTRFLREGRAAIRAKHPNIVQILAIRRHKETGAPYIVMEYVEGEVLQKRLVEARERSSKIGLPGVPILWQISRVLAAAHERGIVHRVRRELSLTSRNPRLRNAPGNGRETDRLPPRQSRPRLESAGEPPRQVKDRREGIPSSARQETT